MRLFLIISLILPLFGYGQYQDIHNILEYDTVISIPKHYLQGDNLEGLVYKKIGNNVWFNITGQYTTDSINLYNLDIESKKIREYQVPIGKYKADFYYGAHDFDIINENKILFLLSNKIIIAPILGYGIEKNDNEIEVFKFENEEDYNQVFNIDNNTVLFCRAYNSYNPYKKDYEKVKFTRWNLAQMKPVRSISPIIEPIEFSQLSPVDLYGFSNNKLLIGQANSLSFKVYNQELDLKTDFKDKTKFIKYNELDVEKIHKINRRGFGDPTDLLNYLSNVFMSGYAFCDGYFFVDSTNILCRYSLGNNSQDTAQRYYQMIDLNDIEISLKNNPVYFHRLPCTHGNIYYLDSVITKKSFPVNFWPSNSIFTKNHIIVFDLNKEYPIGLTWRQHSARKTKLAEGEKSKVSITFIKSKLN